MITNFSYEYKNDDYTFTIKKKEGKNLLSKRNYILKFKNIRNITEVNINDKSIKYNTYYQGDDFIVNINDYRFFFIPNIFPSCSTLTQSGNSLNIISFNSLTLIYHLTFVYQLSRSD